MQIKKIAALCALAFAGAAAHAALPAAPKAVVDNANANGRVIFISGASAVNGGFTQIIGTLFTGTTHLFQNGNYRAAAGTLAAGNGAWSGQNAIIIYRTEGGSVYGVNPVARNEAIATLNVTDATCSGTSAPYTCTLADMVPDAGVSDVAPALFTNPYNTEGDTAAASLSETELAELVSTPLYGLAFGVPVTKNVPASVKLNKATVAAIMAGNIGNWSQVDSSISGDIVICRRVPGSGTQAVFNNYFGSYPCAANANAPADRSASAAWDGANYNVAAGAGGLIVIENSSSGEVRTCLDRAQNGGSYTTKGRDGVTNVTVDFGPLVTAGGVSRKAIGVLSMDSLSNSTAAGNWQFRALDGAGVYTMASGVPVTPTGTGKYPTKDSLVDGTWDLLGMISFNVPNRTIADASKNDVLNNFIAAAKSPAVLNAQSSLKFVAASPAGTDDPAATGNVMRAEYLNGDQCGAYSRNY